MYPNSQFFSFWDTHTVCLISLLFAYGTAQTTYNERGLVGGEVILPCDYNQANDGTLIAVTWTVIIGGSSVNLYIRSGGSTANQITPPADYVGRVELVDDVKLKLTGVILEDDRQYNCAVAALVNSETSVINLQVFKQPSAPVVQVQNDPPTSSMSEVPLNITVIFTCTSTGGRPPATLGWAVTESGTPVSVNPTYSNTSDSQGVGDATSTFNFTTAKYGVTYNAQCTASGPDPIQTRTSAVTSFTTEPVVTYTPITASKSTGPEVSNAPRTDGGCAGPGAVAGAAVGCFIAGLLVGGAAVFLFLRFRTAKNGGGTKDTRDPADGQYENVPHPDQRVASQRPGSGSDDYEVPEVPMEIVNSPSQPPQPSGHYQELRPAVYQSLQRN